MRRAPFVEKRVTLLAPRWKDSTGWDADKEFVDPIHARTAANVTMLTERKELTIVSRTKIKLTESDDLRSK
jgi:hypothetical protein